MMIVGKFKCGHEVSLTGDEQSPRCHCGEARLAGIIARPPKFRGHVLGPHAQYENLPAKAVVLKGESNG